MIATPRIPRVGWRASAAALAALLCGSLVANALLVRAAVAQYNTSSEIRLDPVGLSVYASERGRPPPGRPLLVFFGDSRALMWGRPAFPRYTVINRGIGWQTTAQILARLDADVLDAHPDVVVLEAGVNDLKVIAQLPQHREKIVRDCEANLAQIVEACRRAGARVIVASIFELGDVAFWRRPFWSSSVAVAIREVNAYIAKLAGDGVVVFDANATLDDGHGDVQRAYQLDYLHLNDDAYAALNQKLLPLATIAGH